MYYLEYNHWESLLSLGRANRRVQDADRKLGAAPGSQSTLLKYWRLVSRISGFELVTMTQPTQPMDQTGMWDAEQPSPSNTRRVGHSDPWQTGHGDPWQNQTGEPSLDPTLFPRPPPTSQTSPAVAGAQALGLAGLIGQPTSASPQTLPVAVPTGFTGVDATGQQVLLTQEDLAGGAYGHGAVDAK